MRPITLLPLSLVLLAGAPAMAQSVLFDFNSTPYFTPLPIDITADGLSAHVSATGQGFSVQQAGFYGFTPVGFTGNCLMPGSVFQADLLVGFSKKLTDFSIMFSTQELDCDSAATMKVTAYMDGALVGSSTAVASPPGTWPTGTLHFSSAQGFNSVVVHYQSPPPGCSDYGVIFMADNMTATPAAAPPCPADFNGSGDVDGADLGQLLGAWGGTGVCDLNHDGIVDGADLGALLGSWGLCH